MKVILTLVLWALTAQAYIPPTRTILQKTVENSGRASYKIVKEVRFSNSELPTLKETWLIQNERTFRLTVSPQGIPSAPQLDILYVGGQKYIMSQGHRESFKIPLEHAERPFHYRRTENFVQYLHSLQILSGVTGHLDLARLNRSQGVVNYGLGRPTEANDDRLAPYLWIEQDQFVIRKIRFNSKTELMASRYQKQPRQLVHPNLIVVSWDDQKARVSTLSVSTAKPTAKDFQSSQLADSRAFFETTSHWNSIVEFYKRFR